MMDKHIAQAGPSMAVTGISKEMYASLGEILPMEQTVDSGINLRLFHHSLNPFLLTEEQAITIALK